MKLRLRQLPDGWYPDSERAARRKIENFLRSISKEGAVKNGIAGIVPHAGWEFSGRIAVRVLNSLLIPHDTVVIVGGHLSSFNRILAALEDEFETPLGIISADSELLIEIEKDIRFYPDTDIDNTVEIQLPFIKYLFPESRILWLRASPSDAAIELGRAIHSAALRLNRKVVVIGSTDLTHYGPSYGFMPHGVGEAAVKWVKEVNDRRLIDAILTLNPKEAIKLALKEYSACSAGGVAAALSFAMSSQDKIEAKLLEYANSSDVYPTSSFVGYAGIIFSKEK